MAPEPVRGTRCDSSLIRYVGEYIAAVKGVEPETVFRVTAETPSGSISCNGFVLSGAYAPALPMGEPRASL